ncbi:MAG: slipin family protein [Eubacteriaceae bacterium]|nr:slipin family protein [Eubacteriaceae bacterium]
MVALIPILVIVLILLILSIKQINEYQRGVLFTFGRFSRILTPGLNIVLPIIQTVKKVDIRTKVTDVPEQDALTKDNVSIKINAVVYYRVFDSAKAVLEVENYVYAVSQLSQTTMRNTVGQFTLDELLTNRESISQNLRTILDIETDVWGIKVENVELKDIILPDDMKRVMARVAEAEREKMAVITKSVGEVEAAQNLAKAAEVMASKPGAIHLRTLETINDLSSDQSNTVIFALPIEVLEAIKGLSKQ